MEASQLIEMTPSQYAKVVAQKCIEAVLDMLNAHGLYEAERWVREEWNAPERPVNRHVCDERCGWMIRVEDN